MKNSILRCAKVMGLSLTLLTFSCTDLDEEIFSEVTADTFFTTDEEFIAALGQAYSSFTGIGNHASLWSINEIASDELFVGTKGGDWFDGGVLLQLHQHEFAVDNGFFNNTWTFLFGGINNANRLIALFEGLDSPSSPAFISELRAIRALWYYWALDAFGNVPLVTDFNVTEPPANATRLQVFNFVESELNDVLDDLPTAKDQSTYGRMTKWAALAILTKLYLNAEVYTGTPQYQKAMDAANDIINNGPYSLEAEYRNNFVINNQNSVENILVVPYDKVFAQGFNWSQMTLHYAHQDVFSLAEQPWNGYQTVEEFYNSYVDPVQNPGPQGLVYKDLATALVPGTIDKRHQNNFIVGPQFNPDGSRTIDPGFEGPASTVPDPDGTELNITPEVNEIWPNSLRQSGARIAKYEYEIGGRANMSNDFVLFRLGDIILSLAEAKFRTGDAAGALTLVNQIRNRAGVDPFGTLTEENLLAERGREMFAEMTRRQDQIRFGTWGNAWWEKEVSGPKYQLFPIPKVQLDANSKLTQNPGF